MDETKSYRYPGVRPFGINDSDIFFGRKDDTSKLFKLIMLEKITVLFGKSGHGKSSIINAGIIPKLKDSHTPERFSYHPVEIRIGKVSGQNESPTSKIVAKLDEQFPDLEEWSFLKKYEDEAPSLWHHFKKKQSNDTRKFILIFDQFEEFFTYSDADQKKFRWELAELLYTEIPQSVRENIDDITDEKFTLLSTRFDVKLLFSIRSDRFSLLHSMKDALPCILHSIFEIKGLTRDQATDAIALPAIKPENRFITHPFSYDNNALHIILKELLSVQGDGSEIIEAFHLQIICQACESRIEEKMKDGIIDTEVNEEDLPKFDNLYDEYYKRQIEKLPPALRDKAQTVLEQGLIFENIETGECRRLSVDGYILQRQFDISGSQDDLLNLLENTFLVRREPNTVGGFSYEVSHDTIIEPIIKIKREREKLKQSLIEKEEIRKQAMHEYAIKRRKQALIVLSILFIIVLASWNWKDLYFGYVTVLNSNSKPSVRLAKKLDAIVADLSLQMLQETKHFNVDKKMGAWEASQMMMALKGLMGPSEKNTYHLLTLHSIADSSCCCWVESRNQNDLRPTGWVVSTVSDLGLTAKYKCNILHFFLDNQLEDGSWSMFQIDKKLTQYGSTYATCHVLRALHNSLPNIANRADKIKVTEAIKKGINWLLSNMRDPQKSIWTDYPKNADYEDFLSLSLSGLVIHTLNLFSGDIVLFKFNTQWLQNLKNAQAFTAVDHKEQSDMFYKLNSSVSDFEDRTRHLVIPWEIIATVDAFKDGSFTQRFHANNWLDIVVDNLNVKDIEKNPRFIRAEILISLRYLQNQHYTFQ